MKEKFRKKLRKLAQFIMNPRLLLCFGIAWLITNGWSYILLGIGTFYDINWMLAVSGTYLAFLWLPISPEKIVTVAISIALLRLLFPKDEKTLAVLQQMSHKIKSAIKTKKQERRAAKQSDDQTE